jgi:hypothetical protein
LFSAGFLLGLFFNPEGGDMFLQNNRDLQQTTWQYIPEIQLFNTTICLYETVDHLKVPFWIFYFSHLHPVACIG